MRRRIGKLCTDGAEADDAKRLSGNFRSDKRALAFFDGFGNVFIADKRLRPVDTVHDLTRSKKECCHGKLLYGVCVGTRRIEHDNALFGACIDRNVVDACAGTGNGQKLIAEFHVVHSGRTNHNSVGIFYVFADVVALVVKKRRAAGGNFIQ